MEILALMLPLMLLIALVMLGGLVWALRSGQFDGLEDEKYRIFEPEELVAMAPVGDESAVAATPRPGGR